MNGAGLQIAVFIFILGKAKCGDEQDRDQQKMSEHAMTIAKTDRNVLRMTARRAL
jgi:hypothetical protein